jgi:carboxymethylenebutenolidase
VGRDIDVAGVSVYESGDAGQCVVVLHEWWGLVPHIKDVCDRFAAAGFRAFAPDLYDGATAPEAEPEKAEWLMARLNRSRAIQLVGKVLADLGQGGCHQVALIGFCMGSALPIAAFGWMRSQRDRRLLRHLAAHRGAQDNQSGAHPRRRA